MHRHCQRPSLITHPDRPNPRLRFPLISPISKPSDDDDDEEEVKDVAIAVRTRRKFSGRLLGNKFGRMKNGGSPEAESEKPKQGGKGAGGGSADRERRESAFKQNIKVVSFMEPDVGKFVVN